MTVQEFERLKIDDVICSRFYESEYYQITDTEVFGLQPKVCSGEQIETSKPKYIHIDRGSCDSWIIVGRMVK